VKSAPRPGQVAEGEPGGVAPKRSAFEVFVVSLGLGLTSFGGPIAHLGYFERAYVQRHKWLSSDDYAGLVALCQMLPGPASSQVGALIGLKRAGWAGALAAWIGFTLPSALALYLFALAAPALKHPLMLAGLHGLKLVAVAVVAQAVWSMARKLCPDLTRAGLALTSATLLLVFGGAAMQLAALAIGAIGGLVLCRNGAATPSPPALPIRRWVGAVAFGIFVVLLVGLPWLGRMAPHSLADLAGVFYGAGALVFGGGHVVLPLLHDALVPSGWLSDDAFLAGYGAAQAVPGPLFTFASYLGAAVAPSNELGAAALWASVATLFIFLPGILIAVAGMPLWSWISRHPAAAGALAGVNAAVVGVLGAALYDPIWTSAVRDGRDVAIAVVGFLLLERWKAPPLAVVVFCVTAAVIFQAIR
jgi:chromate transporter